MIIPKKIKVAGHIYSVRNGWEQSDKKADLYGTCLHDTQEILLADSVEANRRMSRSKIEESFVHEMLHAVECVYSVDISEKEIQKLSQGVYQVLKDNRISFHGT